MKEGGVVDFPTINTPGSQQRTGEEEEEETAESNLPSAALSFGSACGWRGP